MRKPVLINPKILRPLHQHLWGSSCSECDKRQSKWEVLREDGEQVVLCSLCLIYSTPWGIKNAAHLEVLIEDIQKEANERFELTPDGRLTINRADQVMGAVALTSRLFEARDRMVGMSKGDGN